MLSFVIPARDRPSELAETLATLGGRDSGGPAAEEVIVLDNASEPRLDAPARLANGSSVNLLRLESNEGAAARNRGVELARGDWVVMLDDDSVPVDGDLATVARSQGSDVAAFGGEIFLPDGSREAGGVPEVIIGCGCVVRRDAFLRAGGYDPSFGYYAEEYDLCARFIGAGLRVHHTRRVSFLHRKTPANRSMDLILGRLVRNNGWTLQRYAPESERAALIEEMVDRYRSIAVKEQAVSGFESGLDELRTTIEKQPVRTLASDQWRRFTGASAISEHLLPEIRRRGSDSVRLVAAGKGSDVIRRVLRDAEIRVESGAEIEVIGTISPGPMLDALAGSPTALVPWALPPAIHG